MMRVLGSIPGSVDDGLTRAQLKSEECHLEMHHLLRDLDGKEIQPNRPSHERSDHRMCRLYQ